MDSPAFAINGMFTAAKVGTSSFTPERITASTRPRTQARTVPRMAVDAFQKKFQTLGNIGIDYSRPKKLASYVRGGYPVTLDYPISPAMAGHYSISNCDVPGGASKILQKYDEYCAKGMMQNYKRSAIPYGVYTPKCTEGTVPQAAFEKRTWNRTAAFRQAQKPVNVRLKEQYEARRCCFIMANNCSREEQQFSTMPMSSSTYMAAKSEAMGTCYRLVAPSTLAEDYMAGSVRAQLTAIQHKMGVYRVGVCEDGYAKGDAENLRVAALGAEYRTGQQSAFTITSQQYESSRTAIKLYGKNCHHEETQFTAYPAVAAAMCRY